MPSISRVREVGGITRFLAALLVCWTVMGCDAPADQTEHSEDSVSGDRIEVMDDAGRSWRFEEPPRRIVSLVPSATGILLGLGMEERLVARTDFDRHDRLSGLPSVGGGLNPSLERLLEVRPDLVIRFEGPTDRATPGALDDLGIAHLAVRPDTIGDIRRIIGLLATVVGEPDRGSALETELMGTLDAVRESVADQASPRVAFLLGGDPPWVAAAGTFLDELLQIAGAENVFGDAGPLYAPVSVEEVLRREPDFLLAPEGARVPGSLDRLPLRRVPESVQSPGLELGESARELARILHPELLR